MNRTQVIFCRPNGRVPPRLTVLKIVYRKCLILTMCLRVATSTASAEGSQGRYTHLVQETVRVKIHGPAAVQPARDCETLTNYDD